MTDQNGGLLDAASQAVRLERIEGEHRLLSQQMKGSLDAMRSTLDSVQIETRTLISRISELTQLQSSHDQNKDALDDLKVQVSGVSTSMHSLFEAQDNKQEQKWRDNVHDRDQWRLRHEAENENASITLGGEIRSVRETVIRAIGWGTGAAALFGIVVGGFLWSINYRFNDITSDNAKDLVRVERTGTTNRALVDQVDKELDDIKLYLARGGRIPEQPYVPASQRSDPDEQR